MLSSRNPQTHTVDWFLDQMNAGSIEPLVAELCGANTTEANVIFECFLAEERRHPLLECHSPQERDALPLSRLLRSLCDNCTAEMADVLDTVSNDFRVRTYYGRALYIHETLGECFAQKRDLLRHGQCWMWRGRIYSDMHRMDQDLPCFWRALAIFQELLIRAQSETDHRTAAYWISYVQHQLGTKCRRVNDDQTALLYLYRAIAIHKQIRADRQRSMSIGNVANCYSRIGRSRVALLNQVRDLSIKVAIANSTSQSPSSDYSYYLPSTSYLNFGIMLADLGEASSALRVIQQGQELDPLRTGLIKARVQVLFMQDRHEECQQLLEEVFFSQKPEMAEIKLWAGQTILTVLNAFNQTEQAGKWYANVIDHLLTGKELTTVFGDELKEKIASHLATIANDDYCGQALLLYASGHLDDARVHARQALDSQPALTPNQTESMNLLVSPAFPAVLRVSDAKPVLVLPPVDAESISASATTAVPHGRAFLPHGQCAIVDAFQIDTLPVTNRVFAMYLGDTQCETHPERFEHPLWSHPDQPVTGVSLRQCRDFCAWRSRVTGQTWDLPTMEEWCRAALGDDGRRFPWGDEAPDHTRAAYAVFDDADAFPAPVGLVPAGTSPWGAGEMAGNVWEWTSSQDSSGRWYRMGGSCGNDARALDPKNLTEHILHPVRSADYINPHLGFRCVLRTTL